MSQSYPAREIIAEFIGVKRFCLWLRNELQQGINLLERETDRKVIMLNCDLIIASPRPTYVADMLHNVIWPATSLAIEDRVVEMCSRSATVACFLESEDGEIHHGPIERF